MADASKIVEEFLGTMGPVREALGDFVRALYNRAEVKIIHEFHPLAYTCSEFDISAELRNGAVVDFWVDLEQADSQWKMRYSVQRHDPDEDGSHREHDFPVQRVASAMNLAASIVSAIEDLRRGSADDKLFR